MVRHKAWVAFEPHDADIRQDNKLRSEATIGGKSHASIQHSPCHHHEAWSTNKPGWEVEEGTGSEIEKNRIIVISCKKYEQPKCKQAKPSVETPLTEASTSSHKRRS
jgi:hypothetical protein